MAITAKPHGHFLAGEAGELAGVSGNTVGQWARWGYIRASQSAGDPHVYSVEDIAEAAIVRVLLERGVRHADIRHAVRPSPLRRLAAERGAARHHAGRPARDRLRERRHLRAVGARLAVMSAPPALDDVRLRLATRS